MIIYVLEIAKKIVYYSVKRGTGKGKMKTGKKNRKWTIGLRFKFAFVHIFHFPVPVIETGARIILIIIILLTFFSHFVSTYNICTICRRRILVEIPSTLFQGCFTTKTGEVSEPYWDIRGTKNSVS